MLPTHVLLPLSLALCAAAGGSATPADFAVPSVDFSRLSGDASNAYNRELLRALQRDGILALRNVPRYAELRSAYLETAAECAVSAAEGGAEFLLHRQLRDGTNRYTISMESGRKLGDSAADEVLVRCPAYQDVYQQFSAVVEAAVANVGSALDATQEFQVVVEGGETAMLARKLMDESVHLDHFHAYEAAAGLDDRRLDEAADVTSDLSLEMHTDNGLMIAMSAPEYFDVSPSGQVTAKQTRSEDAGLLIQTAAGEVVAPLLLADELVLMLGSGIDQWIQTSPPLRPVLHGMRYPRGLSYADGSSEGEAEHHKLLRAWFGKMVLLEPFQVMANTGMTYGEYANQTTRYLLERGDEDQQMAFAAAACPPHRQLAASDSSCSLKVCSPKSSAAESELTYSCQVTCNHDSTSDAALCEQYCDCEDASGAGTTCWMLCVADLDEDVCPGTQQCNQATTEETLAMECVGGTVAPSASASSASASSASGSGSAQESTATPTSTPTETTATPEPATGSASAASSTGTVAPSNDVGESSASGSESSADSAAVGSSASSDATPTPTPTSGASSVFAAAGSALAAAVALAIAAQ